MFRFGADYYPEHWPEARWPEDAQLMKAAGFNVVRLAEFAWSLLEPQEGVFDFDWLDRAIAILGEQKIDVILGTPTAAPPPWLMVKGTDLFIVNEDGRRVTYGLRREYCPNNPLYHEYTDRIVAQMAAHYAGHAGVIGWQIDNEFGNRCYCEICRNAFHQWLKRRYCSLDELNEKWGTVFWSHVYTDWAQIPAPLNTAHTHNPGLALDYKRFMSDTYRGYQKRQIDVIRRYTTEQFITHNLMGFGYNLLDYYDNAADLDFVSWDNYKRTQWDMKAALDPSLAALSADTMRGLKKRNFWVMEQQSGGGGWDIVAVTPKPGELRLWTYQTIAHGADGMLYFRWRTCRSGTEQNWQGILEHHGIPSRRYEEVVQVGAELSKIGAKIHGSQPSSQVAIMQSYDSRFAFQVQPNNPRFVYEAHIHALYKGFYNHNVPAAIVSEKDPLTDFRVVIVPAMYVLTAETAANLERFAAQGGIVVFTARTGVKDEYNLVVNTKLPGLVSQMAGVEIDDYVSLPIDADSQIQFDHPDLAETYTVSAWADLLTPTSAQTIAWYASDYYNGQSAVTVNRFGAGKVIYVGAFGEEPFYADLTRLILGMADIEPILETVDGVEVAQRWQGDRRLMFVLNHVDEAQTVVLEDTYKDLISGEVLRGEVQLAPYDVRIMISAS